MTGLGIDTSGDVLSVALLRNDESYYAEMDAGLRHSERLMAVIDGLLAMAAAKPTDLDFVACLGGPGSFTGLRIGLSAAKGLSTALGIPLYTVPTLEAAAAARSSWPDTVLPLIDAKKNRWYTAAFKGGVRRCEDMDAGAEDIVRILKNTRSSVILVCGTDAPRAADILSAALPEARFVVDADFRRGAAKELVVIARDRMASGDRGADASVGLEYLRKSEAEITRDQKTGEADERR